MNAPERYFNRELSWLEFNHRVLQEAFDPSVPLLERVFFLTITASNLDEFFMVRVGGLHLMTQAVEACRDPAGLLPAEQLEQVRARVARLVSDQYRCLYETLLPALSDAGIHLLTGPLDPAGRAAMEVFFKEELDPVLTPVAVTARDRFPLLHSGSPYLACRVATGPAGAPDRLVLLRLSGPRRFVSLPRKEHTAFVPVETVVCAFLDRLLPGQTVQESVGFRITRNADLPLGEEYAEDLAEAMQRVLRERKTAPCVRMEIGHEASPELRRMLIEALDIAPQDVYDIPGLPDLTALGFLSKLHGLDSLRYPEWPAQPCAMVDPGADPFEQIAARDILLSLPYESFDPVIRLIETAAVDPSVLAIKIVLYRVTDQSPIVRALHAAARAGKSVTAVVELKARFDEAVNIAWAESLEAAGVQVVYGIRRLKTHAKICMIVRRESGGIVRYVHLATGNYNEKTARTYTDVGLLTAHPAMGQDAAAFFHAITGYSEPLPYRILSQAPLNLREHLLERIAEETGHAAKGMPAWIRAKMNNLVDPRLIDALYEASRQGVRIDLSVRGICCLRPGVPGLSERIRVSGVIDRYLEHSRVFAFHNGGEPRVFLSSADWMPRNLDRRIELLVPVVDAAVQRKLLALLACSLGDTRKAWRLEPDGRYRRIESDGAGMRSQEQRYLETVETVGRDRRRRRTVFEPHRPANRKRARTSTGDPG